MKNEPCCKCKTELSTVRLRHTFYCNKCFVYTFVGKYRSNLNRSKAIGRKKGKVLLACSGGPSSIAMLHLTSTFMVINPNEKKKVAMVPSAVVCHIDESTLFGEQEGSSAKLQAMVETKYPQLSFLSQRMEDVFDADFEKRMKNMAGTNRDYEHLVQLLQQSNTDASNMTNSDRLKDLFNNISKNTAKEDLYWNFKFTMLLGIARKEGCDYIFMADSSTRQAIKMISKISNGRGYSIPFDVGLEVDGCFDDVVILRPMKDMLAKEMGMYNRLHGIDHDVTAPFNWGTYMPPKSSIERLTEDFIVGLDRDFPSTVSTISRTASKLTPHSNIDYSKSCAICQMPYEANIPEWRKHITVTKVEQRSGDDQSSCLQEGCCGGSKEDGGCGTGGGGGGCSSDTGPVADLNAYLCYSCQVNLKDYKNDAVEMLPPFVVQKVYDQEREQRLREQIQEFLIDDDDDE
ncbi:hypothetical protein [Absidia glauca]|uniref:Cytoplasmic tRNA 2-thiolation protein 2 n=1 Tax=Absidia glauca TaxID=4829 RepID=A0A168SZR5_ABSGL|nr:hypothetical protein [Absidia glauca]